MKVTRCFRFFSSTSGQRKTGVSGFKSLIKSFIHRPARWRKVRENKLSHRVLFKLSDPFQHALPASLFACVWGLGWGDREGEKGKKKKPMAESPWNSWRLSNHPPPPPTPNHFQPVLWARAPAELLCHKTPFRQLCSQVPPRSQLGTPRPHRRLPTLDGFQRFQAHLTAPFC